MRRSDWRLRLEGRLRFVLNRLGERLWVRPLLACGCSVAGVLLARVVDATPLAELLPEIGQPTLRTLLQVMASGMLVIATFAVASMVQAYASASIAATPRAFPLVVADDVSQNALSIFVAAFIFSIVGLTAVENDFYGPAGRFTLFVLTMGVFAVVIGIFVRWTDRIARLGRLGHTIDKVERATAQALARRRERPTLGAAPARPGQTPLHPIYGPRTGHVQLVDVRQLQQAAEAADTQVRVAAVPGDFVDPTRPLAWTDAAPDARAGDGPLAEALRASFVVGARRTLDHDPAFGLEVLAEIAGKALSPAVNDPGTAAEAVDSLTRLLVDWGRARPEPQEPDCPRVQLPPLHGEHLLQAAVPAFARHCAADVDCACRLQRALATVARNGDAALAAAARDQAQAACQRAAATLALAADREAVAAAARAHGGDGDGSGEAEPEGGAGGARASSRKGSPQR